MDNLKNYKYKTLVYKMNDVAKTIVNDNIQKYRFGHQWKYYFSVHFCERMIERDIPPYFVANCIRVIMEDHRFDLRRSGMHAFVCNKYPFIIETEQLSGFVTNIKFITVLADNHIIPYSEYKFMYKIPLKRLMTY